MTRAALVAVALLGACGPELGAPGVWLGPDELDDQTLRPELAGDAYAAPAPGETLRVVSFNVHHGADVDALAAALATHAAVAGADAILLQEIEAHPDEGASRAARLAEALAMNHVYAPARHEDGGATHGLAVLARHPLRDVAVMELARADIGFHDRRRIALAVTMDVGAAAIRLIDVHLDTRLGVVDRLRQLRPAVIDHGDGPIVVAGDFNTLPYAWVEGVIPSVPAQAAVDFDAALAVDALMIGQGFAAPTSALGPTDDVPVLSHRLDAIYVRGLDVVDAAIGEGTDVSDHRPVSVDVATPVP